MRAKNLLFSIIASIALMTGAPVCQAGIIDDLIDQMAGGAEGPQGGGGGGQYPNYPK